MYSREVPLDKIPSVEHGSYLESIYEQQKGLLDYYTKLEKLPEYPINIDLRQSQVIIKDFTDRVIEELAEAYEYQLEIWNIAEANGYFSQAYVHKSIEQFNQARTKIINCVHDFNEELADAMHFMVELLIYANISPQDVKDYAIKHHPNYSLGQDLCSKPTLESIMILGADLVNFKPMNKVPIVHFNTLCDPREYNEVHQYSPVGWQTSKELLDKYSLPLWDIVYSLKMSTNCLKNRPWKRDERVVDIDKYQSLVAEAFVKMMGYYYHIGLRPDTLHNIYSLKNQVNKFRVESNY